MNELTTFISTIGFPILACVVMYKREEKLTGIINNLCVTLKGIEVTLSNMNEGEK